jgi:hypothetical protein
MLKFALRVPRAGGAIPLLLSQPVCSEKAREFGVLVGVEESCKVMSLSSKTVWGDPSTAYTNRTQRHHVDVGFMMSYMKFKAKLKCRRSTCQLRVLVD